MKKKLSPFFLRLLCLVLVFFNFSTVDAASRSRSKKSERGEKIKNVVLSESEKKNRQEAIKASSFVPGTGVDDDVTESQGDEKDKETGEQGVAEAPDYIESQGEGRPDLDESVLTQLRSNAASEASAFTRKNARTMALLIPAPRGQIVDRFGEPLAQNVVNYQLSLKFGQFEEGKDDRDSVVAFGRSCVDQAKVLTGSSWEFTDDQLWNHYKYRRWLPLPLTNILSDEVVGKIVKKLPKGLELLPIYKRQYPQGKTAAHILGYVGVKGKLPTGPINYMDPLWEISVGRSGLESYMDKPLTGRPGVWRLMFNEKGEKILDELSMHPKCGGTVVTTLNLKWQKIAEDILSNRCKRGAFVVLDVQTGEVLVLASYPSFDPNGFVPKISSKDYKALQKNPDNPLVSRAFQGVYPPASTFKTVVGLSALDNGTITKNTIIYCPAAITVGNHTFKNWSKVPEGNINVCRALARSTNPFFYQIAQKMGATPFLSMARKLGMGQRTGLPIQDQTGTIPDDEWLRAHNRRKFSTGDALNLSIGQGVATATPLQVAQAMVGIARGDNLPKLHLIKQVQDIDGNVVFSAHRELRNAITTNKEAVEAVHQGMSDVVDGGTGARANVGYVTMCGKTGTGQWGSERENKRVGWFAGFLPRENPRYAFAALYEGSAQEKVGGSSNAAPIVKEFFTRVKEDVQKVLKQEEEAKNAKEEAENKKLDEQAQVEGGPVDAEEVSASVVEEEGNAEDKKNNETKHSMISTDDVPDLPSGEPEINPIDEDRSHVSGELNRGDLPLSESESNSASQGSKERKTENKSSKNKQDKVYNDDADNNVKEIVPKENRFNIEGEEGAVPEDVSIPDGDDVPAEIIE